MPSPALGYRPRRYRLKDRPAGSFPFPAAEESSAQFLLQTQHRESTARLILQRDHHSGRRQRRYSANPTDRWSIRKSYGNSNRDREPGADLEHKQRWFQPANASLG